MGIEQILKTETSPEDKISMIISNNLDLMFGEKAAVTIDNWKKLGSEILAWHEYEVKKQSRPMDTPKDKIEGLCKWLRETKGITTIDVVELASYMPEYEEFLEEQKKAWISTPVKCDLCGHKWVAVHHIESDRLECPRCYNMTIFD